jgi:hypothetical protein
MPLSRDIAALAMKSEPSKQSASVGTLAAAPAAASHAAMIMAAAQ